MSKAKTSQENAAGRAGGTTPDHSTVVQNNQADAGGEQMRHEQEQYHSVNPNLSGGDLDASWQEAEDDGSESVGGHAPTPDQDEVDEIGRALGMEFQDNQELHTHDEVLGKRDRHRWELDRRSAEDASPDE